MAEDIAPELLEKIREAFRENCSTNKDIQEISQKVADGTAGYRDLEAYAIAAGDMLAKAMHDNVSGDILPDGKMYYNIASRILPPNLEECHEMVAEIAEGIYGILNEQAGLHIKALRPDLNRDRIDGLVNYVSNADQYEDVRKSTEQDVVNFSQSVATDAVHKNADFQYKAGLTPKIRRSAKENCCEWCQSLEGTYDYADVRDTGNDVWRRHRKCKCEITYDPGTGRIQNAHSKTWSWKEENKEKVAERTRIGTEDKQVSPRIREINAQARLAAKHSTRQGDTIREEFETIPYELAKEAIKYYGDYIRDLDVEHAFVIQKDGKVIHFIGKEDFVDLFDVNFDGAYITHNHPEVNGIVSFGKDDFVVLQDNPSIAEFNCVNSLYDYSVIALESLNEISYHDIELSCWDEGDINEDIQHKVMAKLDEMGVIKYVRERIDR